MKVAITGSSGFIGQNLARYLRQHSNYEILPISRSNSKTDEGILLNQFLASDTIEYDAVVHLAGKAHDLKNSSDPEAYYQANLELTRDIFQHFLQSSATSFLFMSSVKAVSDNPTGILTENYPATPATPYGKSKLAAEKFLQQVVLPVGKRLFILRPCMIHGPGNKGNLNLLTKIVKKQLPYPLGAFHNQRSFLSVNNCCFVIHQILSGNIPAGIYNIADDESISTNDLVRLIGQVMNKPARIWNIPPKMIHMLAKTCDVFGLPLTSENLQKLTGNYIVSNTKITQALRRSLPISTRQGLMETLQSFQ